MSVYNFNSFNKTPWVIFCENPSYTEGVFLKIRTNIIP